MVVVAALNHYFKCKRLQNSLILFELFDFLFFSHSGQQLAQQMQATNPELVEQLRRQMGGGAGPNPFDPSSESEPKGPQ